MNEHLKELSTRVTPSSIALVICDGAAWHQRGKQLIVPENIRLLSLPPYSPELNPMENVWDYLRQNKLCALVWDTYAHDSPHIYTIPKVSANTGTSASIATNVSISGNNRSSGMFGINS